MKICDCPVSCSDAGGAENSSLGLNDDCGEISLARKRVNYIECILNKKRDRFELIAANPKKGEFDSKKVEAGMLKDTE